MYRAAFRYGSKQKGDAKECSVTVNLTLDTGAVAVPLPLPRALTVILNQFTVAYVVKNRVRRHSSG